MKRYILIQDEYKGKVTIADRVTQRTKDITLKEFEELKKNGEVENE